mmetsp:Transcript_89797/g.200712  ORF Transcript_89797/g.200712 Transcript_89797/m.200712 type:complete len:647 (+) Transcript_89797:73-2013(+)
MPAVMPRDDEQTAGLMKASQNSDDSDAESSELQLSPDEEEEITSRIVDLLFAHKQAFEAETKEDYDRCDLYLKDLGKEESPWDVPDSDTFLLEWIDELRHDGKMSAGLVFPDATRWYHLRKLKKVWSSDSFTIDQITHIMRIVGPGANKFVHALSVRVPEHMVKGHTLQLQNKTERVKVICGGFGGAEKRESQKLPDDEFNTLNMLAPRRVASDRSILTSILGASVKVGVQIHFCGVKALAKSVDQKGEGAADQTVDALLFNLALEDSYDETCLFTPPVAQAMVWRSWAVAWPEYLWARFNDVAFQVALMMCITEHCRYSHSPDASTPDALDLAVLTFFNCRAVINLGTEMFVILRQPKERKILFLKAYIDFYMLACLCLELSIVCFNRRLIAEHFAHTPPQAGILYRRPFWYFFIILGKSTSGTISLFNLNFAMESFLPSWLTFRHKDSLMFMFFLVIMSELMALAYFSLPVPDIISDTSPWHSMLKSFTRMMRVLVFADFDSSELEGTEQQIKRVGVDPWNHSNGCNMVNTTFEMEDAGSIAEIHHDLIWLPPFFGFISSVIFLNVYIGVLSEVYAKVKENMIQHAGRFRVSSTFRYLLIRQFYVGCGFPYKGTTSVRGNVAEGEVPEGFWIKIPSRLMVDPLP